MKSTIFNNFSFKNMYYFFRFSTLCNLLLLSIYLIKCKRTKIIIIGIISNSIILIVANMFRYATTISHFVCNENIKSHKKLMFCTINCGNFKTQWTFLDYEWNYFSSSSFVAFEWRSYFFFCYKRTMTNTRQIL